MFCLKVNAQGWKKGTLMMPGNLQAYGFKDLFSAKRRKMVCLLLKISRFVVVDIFIENMMSKRSR